MYPYTKHLLAFEERRPARGHVTPAGWSRVTTPMKVEA